MITNAKIKTKHRKHFFMVSFLILGLLFSSLIPPNYVQAEAQPKDLNPSMTTVLSTVRSYMLSHDLNPDYNSIWNVIGLTRSGLSVPADYTETFYKNTVNYLEEKNWVLTRTKYSDYSKLILGMTTIGKDAQNIAGHNLLAYLSDFSKIKLQGFNGPIWALIALKSHPSYQIPADPNAVEQTTEEGLITYLLNRETPYGGWTLTGNQPDTDITGMTIQALSPYYGIRSDVTKAIDRALAWLSEAQLASGGYGTMGTETSESVAQIIVALSSIGVDPSQDDRFIKDGNWPMTGLFQYYLPEGGFMHVAADAENNGGAEGGIIDGMATEQGMYATVAYKRMLENKAFLYDMSDIELVAGEKPGKSESSTSTQKQEQTTQAAKTIAVSMVRLDYSQISVIKGQKKTLTVTVLPASASNKNVTWKSSNKKIATVSQKGVVKGVKKGTATITVTAKDGSGKKATCKVTVTETQSGNTNSNSTTGTNKRPGYTAPTITNPATNRQTTTTNQSTTTASTQKKKDPSEEGTTQAEGWSFDGDDYVLEGNEEDTGEETTEETIDDTDGEEDSRKGVDWDGKNLTITIPLGPIAYVLLGMVISGGIEAVIFFFKKKR